MVAGLALIILSGCATLPTRSVADTCASHRNSPITNFCEVKPESLWRGAQPEEAGFAWLIGQGVRTVVNLELLHDDLPDIRRAPVTSVTDSGIAYFRVRDWEPLPGFAPSIADEHVVHFLAIASQSANQPVYVHCRSGQNRTGVMVAAFRIVQEGKTNVEQVIDEMKSYGGAWAGPNSRYIRGLASRREEILQKVALRIPTLEAPATVLCRNGSCEDDPQPRS